MTRPSEMDVGFDLAPGDLDTAIPPLTPEAAHKAALHVVTAGRDVAERRELLEMLGLWGALQ